MDKVIKAVSDVERKVKKIDAMTSKGMDNMSLKDVIKMVQKGNSINKTIKKSMKEYDGSAPTDAQASEIMKHMEVIVPIQCRQMELAIKDKPQAEKLHAAGLVKKNIQKSYDTAQQLSKMMMEHTPPAYQARAKELDDQTMASFNKALAAYSGASGGEDIAEAEAEDASD